MFLTNMYKLSMCGLYVRQSRLYRFIHCSP